MIGQNWWSNIPCEMDRRLWYPKNAPDSSADKKVRLERSLLRGQGTHIVGRTRMWFICGTWQANLGFLLGLHSSWHLPRQVHYIFSTTFSSSIVLPTFRGHNSLKFDRLGFRESGTPVSVNSRQTPLNFLLTDILKRLNRSRNRIRLLVLILISRINLEGK